MELTGMWLGQTIECCVESGDGAYRYVARADHRVLELTGIVPR